MSLTSKRLDNKKFDHKSYLKNLTSKPGVYQMLKGDEIIYVGKAKNLNKRLSSYFQKQDHSAKTKTMVALLDDIQIIVTQSENEALILENQLIKKHRPRYNVVFKDDKSYPYIFLSNDQYPRLSVQRGRRRQKGDYFGPFPGASAARYSISLMQKLFLIRQCENSYFRHRSRPCLQYQIKRCSGPCVNKISQQEYLKDVELVRLFYQGKNQSVLAAMTQKMQHAADDLNYEDAAQLRDQIIQLRKILQKQTVQAKHNNLDVIAADLHEQNAGIFLLHVRNGMVLGNRSFFPKTPAGTAIEEVLETFINYFYLNSQNELPGEIVISHQLTNARELKALLKENRNNKITLSHQVKTNRAAWLELAQKNLREMMKVKLASKSHIEKKLHSLMQELSLDKLPMRMECFDISHFQGEETVASCVVFEKGVAKKTDYRRFNIRDVKAADDYAAIEQAVKRRFQRLVKEDAKLPDLLIIDGGKGQLNQAQKVLEELALQEITLISIAKGSDRKAGMEQIFFPHQARATKLAENSLALHLLQTIRDEAHRFAITGHRGKRDKKRKTSSLESIPGVGAKRRKAMITHFGGLQGVQQASVNDLKQVSGISQQLAQIIYDHLH